MSAVHTQTSLKTYTNLNTTPHTQADPNANANGYAYAKYLRRRILHQLKADLPDRQREKLIYKYRYWERLMLAEVPSQDAWEVAKVIARYDVDGRLPTAAQRNLIGRYCVAVCRAELWRRELLLPPHLHQRA